MQGGWRPAELSLDLEFTRRATMGESSLNHLQPQFPHSVKWISEWLSSLLMLNPEATGSCGQDSGL